MSIESIVFPVSGFLIGLIIRRGVGAYLWLQMDMESSKPTIYEIGIFVIAMTEFIVTFSNEQYMPTAIFGGYLFLFFHDCYMSSKE